ncbi:hypothetical protein HDU99_006522 [Rhizoclosmatium hyalinum]|nr:hypothetical protein HDU99_006522 [Rhizoclosmatium hyalinum]
MTRVLEAWRSLKRGMRESLDGENNGSLRPVVDMITGAQMQGCLMAFLPSMISLDTGNMVVDMFVSSSLVTLLMAFIGLLGSTIRKIIDDDSEVNSDINLCVKVEFHMMDRWNEAQENPHWKALAWIITQRSKEQTKGHFRMIPFIPENDGDSSSDEEEDDELQVTISIPDFNILPIGDRELEIDFNKGKYIVQFDDSGNQANQNKLNDGDGKNKIQIDPLINREPPILIRRIDGEVASLSDMQATLNEITKIYARDQARKKRRSRYERPADCSYWCWTQTIRSERGLASVALDETQETLLLRDLETFANDKHFYKRMGLPYRRGYLFSGKPGTGKTSLINAISATYNRDLYYINLADIKSDNELQSAFSSVSKGSIIVFEDIDAQSAEVHTRERRFALKKVDKMRAYKEKELEIKRKKREEAEKKLLEDEDKEEEKGEDGEKKSPAKKTKSLEDFLKEDLMQTEEEDMLSDFGGFKSMGPMIGPSLPSKMDFGDLKLTKGSLFSGFTLSMLLNCLDGHMLAEDVIIIMTSNHPEVLDPALIRPGRIDLHLSLGYCTHYQMNRMLQSVLDDKTACIDFNAYPIPQNIIAPCDALRICILYRSNPSVIPIRLMERGMELLSGKSQSSGIQAGESSMALEVTTSSKPELFDSSMSVVSLDSGIISGSDVGSEAGECVEGIRERKPFAATSA